MFIIEHFPLKLKKLKRSYATKNETYQSLSPRTIGLGASDPREE